MKLNKDKKAIGERIYNIRNKMNLTLEEFGKIFGASKGNVLNWENGNVTPNKSRIEKIAKKGNMTVNELLYGSVEELVSNNIDNWIDSTLNEKDIHLYFGKIDKAVIKNLILEDFKKNNSDIENLYNLEEAVKNNIDMYITETKKDISTLVEYIEHNKKIADHIFNLIKNDDFFEKFYSVIINMINNNRTELDFTYTLDDFLKTIYSNDLKILLKIKPLLDELKLNIEDDIKTFNGYYLKTQYYSVDLNTLAKFENMFDIDSLNYFDIDETFYPDWFPLSVKPNKYKITNYKYILGLYIDAEDTLYYLANYSSLKDTPLLIESNYFILYDNNDYEIRKLTNEELNGIHCRYIAPILGRME